MKFISPFVIGIALFCTQPKQGNLFAAGIQTSQLETQFFQLCDVAADELNSPERKKPPFYIDSYAVRSLAVAYDLTGEKKYLAACKTWSDRMISFQEKMIPNGAYFMNYNRQPGQTNGGWYVADSASIAMGVLATAVRCTNAVEKARYVDSANNFAKLVLENYLGASGGVRNGLWPKFDGEWWCCSGTFGSLAFLLYDETGEQRYLDAGLNAAGWLSKQDLNTTSPYTLKEMGPCLPMYFFEAFSAGWPQIKKQSGTNATARKQIDSLLKWSSDNLCGKGDSQRFQLDSQWGSKFGGIPFHIYVHAENKSKDAARKIADRELQEILLHIFASGKPTLSQLAAFTMMSCAERLNPGAIYRNSKTLRNVASKK